MGKNNKLNRTPTAHTRAYMTSSGSMPGSAFAASNHFKAADVSPRSLKFSINFFFFKKKKNTERLGFFSSLLFQT